MDEGADTLPATCFISHTYADAVARDTLIERLPTVVTPFLFPPIADRALAVVNQAREAPRQFAATGCAPVRILFVTRLDANRLWRGTAPQSSEQLALCAVAATTADKLGELAAFCPSHCTTGTTLQPGETCPKTAKR